MNGGEEGVGNMYTGRLRQIGAKMALIVAMVTALVAALPVAGAPPLNVALFEAKLNGLHVFDLTVDKVTDLLGRPTAVEPEQQPGGEFGIDLYFGPKLLYHHLGLSFSFQHSVLDVEQKCFNVALYLSEAWDDKLAKRFMPFAGTVTGAVTGDWKVKRLLDAFAAYSPVDRYSKEAVKKVEQALGELPKQLADSLRPTYYGTLYIVDIKCDHHDVSFRYEPNTTFLEQILLRKRDALFSKSQLGKP